MHQREDRILPTRLDKFLQPVVAQSFREDKCENH